MTRTSDDGVADSLGTTPPKGPEGRKKRRNKDAAAIEAEREVARISARQWATFTSQQARTAGFSRDQVVHRLKSGRWRQPARGVYVIAGAPGSWEQALMVACLAGPAGTVASHLSAAALFGLARRRRR